MISNAAFAQGALSRLDEELAYLRGKVSLGQMLGDASMGISAGYLAHLLRHMQSLSGEYERLIAIEARYEQAESDLQDSIDVSRALNRRLVSATTAIEQADAVVVEASTLALHFEPARIAEVRERIATWRENAAAAALPVREAQARQAESIPSTIGKSL